MKEISSCRWAKKDALAVETSQAASETRGMNEIITDNLTAIQAICAEFGGKRLELFGSAARDDFDLETSDIDVIVDFLDYGLGVADRYFRLTSTLQELLGRPVDVTFARKLSNPYFLDEIEADRTTLCDAEHHNTAA